MDGVVGNFITYDRTPELIFWSYESQAGQNEGHQILVGQLSGIDKQFSQKSEGIAFPMLSHKFSNAKL